MLIIQCLLIKAAWILAIRVHGGEVKFSPHPSPTHTHTLTLTLMCTHE